VLSSPVLVDPLLVVDPVCAPVVASSSSSVAVLASLLAVSPGESLGHPRRNDANNDEAKVRIGCAPI
jgi:hypothetical protein